MGNNEEVLPTYVNVSTGKAEAAPKKDCAKCRRRSRMLMILGAIVMTAFVFSLGRSFERSIALDRYGNFGVSDGFPGDDRFDFDKVRSHHNGTHRPHRGKPRHRRRPHHGDHPPHHDDHPRPPHHGDHPHPPHHGDHDYPHDPPHGDHRGPPPKDNEEVPLRDEEASASETSGDTE